MMKKLIYLAITIMFVFVSQCVNAQKLDAPKFRIDMENSNQNAIEFTLSRGEISIEGHNSNELIIENTDYEAPPERADGLQPLTDKGTDNTGIGLSVQEQDGVLKIVETRNNDGEFILKVPNNIRLKIQKQLWSGEITIRDHKGEIEVQSKFADISLMNITGPVIVNSISGNVDAVFSNISNATPSSVSVTHGYIDVTLPADTQSNVYLSSTHGEIYTDLDLQLKNKKESTKPSIGPQNIVGTLNGGGVNMTLRTISDDIYLRKNRLSNSRRFCLGVVH